jgi:hypothetical protein
MRRGRTLVHENGERFFLRELRPLKLPDFHHGQQGCIPTAAARWIRRRWRRHTRFDGVCYNIRICTA